MKRKWLSDLELDEIQRNIEDIGHAEMGLESDEDEGWFLGFDHEGQNVIIKKCEVVLEKCVVLNDEAKEAMFL